jgi:plastocyanin
MKKVLVFCILSILVLAGCATTQQPAPPVQQPPVQPQQPGQPSPPVANPQQPPPQKQSVEVKMQGLKFVPNSITVNAGTEVLWVNLDNVDHTVTIDSLGIDERVAAGAQFSHVFGQAGTFDCRCAIHPSMRGTVIVTGSVAAGGSECTANTDCVPEQCCHPTSCIPSSAKGPCTLLCTMDCAPNTMDCGQGHCACVSGKCTAVIAAG